VSRAYHLNVSHADPSPSAARLVLRRQSPRDARQRQVYASLDDEYLGMLVFGEQITRDVAPGRHVLKANNTLVWKSYEFEARSGEDISISLINYQPRGFMAMLAVFGVGVLLLSIERDERN
jgi:hypothetical protein